MPHDKSNAGSVQPYIVHVARECAEIAPAGGVGDVVLQLALESARIGFPTAIVLPHYGAFSQRRLEHAAARILQVLPWAGAKVRIPQPLEIEVAMAYTDAPQRVEVTRLQTVEFEGRGRLTLVFVVANRFTEKERPYTYTAAEARSIVFAPPGTATVCGAERPPADFPVAEGTGHFDFFAMNVLLQRAALAWMESLDAGSLVVHAHDAHTAMLPMMAKLAEPPSPLADSRFVATAHNCGIAYRQRCADLDFVSAITGLPRAAIDQCLIEGEFDPFGSAALYADHLSTVSEGYAWEVQSAWMPTSGGDPEVVGFSEFLQRNGIRICGFANGVDPSIKGPDALRDEIGRTALKSPDFGWKADFRRRFAVRISRAKLPPKWGIAEDRRFGNLKRLPEDGCLFTFVGRWTAQKGVDIIARAAKEVLRMNPDAGLCLFGEGNQALLADILELVDEFPGRVVAIHGFSERLAASVYAAGDFFLVPSRFEPCGLIDMIAQLNGNIPIVNQVGGLAKVVDGVTGIGYFALNDRENMWSLVRAMRRAINLAGDSENHRQMQRAANEAVRDVYSWSTVFRRYAALYGVNVKSTPRVARQRMVEA